MKTLIEVYISVFHKLNIINSDINRIYEFHKYSSYKHQWSLFGHDSAHLADYQIIGGQRMGILLCSKSGAKMMSIATVPMYVGMIGKARTYK